MSPHTKQQQLGAKFGLIEDQHERLAAIVDRVRKLPPFEPAQRLEENRVQGCISRVWLISSLENGVCRFRVDADSSLVRGLAALVCEVYDGASPQEIAAHDGDILADLNLTAHLSPTRQHGLEQFQLAIRQFAVFSLKR